MKIAVAGCRHDRYNTVEVTMVQRVPQSVEVPVAPTPVNISVLTERLRAVLGIHQRLNELMGDWGQRSEHEPDATVISVACYYQDLCRDLNVRMAEVGREIRDAGLSIDLQPLIDAREHLAIVAALNPENFVRARQDIKEGRTMSLEQMRRELRHPAH